MASPPKPDDRQVMREWACAEPAERNDAIRTHGAEDPFETAMKVASGHFANYGCFSRMLVARAYFRKVLQQSMPYPWASDWAASEWLKQFEGEQ